MRGVLLVGLLLAAGAGPRARADEPRPEDAVFVEQQASPTTCLVGEPLVLRLRVGVDRAFLAARAAPLFRQATDVPIHVQAPWWRGLPGARAVPGPTVLDVGEGASRLRVAVNDEIVGVLHERNVNRAGRTYAVLELSGQYLPERAGVLVVPATAVRFVVSSRFEEDFVGGRIAVDPQDVFVRCEPLAVQVQAWPAQGRPAIFRDAVGRFRVDAATSRQAVQVGETLTLLLRFEGEGNLAQFEAPRLDALDGFHVLGVIDDRAPVVRTVRYELAALRADVTAVPAIPFAFLEPGPPPAYRVVHTEALALQVRAARAEPVDGATPGAKSSGGAPAPWVGAWPWVLALAGALVAARLLAVRRRRRARARGVAETVDAGRARVAAATAALRTRAAGSVVEQAEAFARLLAAHLDCSPAAVVSPHLARRLAASGLAPAVATRAAATLERLTAARYGSGEDAPDLGAAWLAELEAALLATRSPTGRRRSDS